MGDNQLSLGSLKLLREIEPARFDPQHWFQNHPLTGGTPLCPTMFVVKEGGVGRHGEFLTVQSL